jgi:O-methyltransferase
VSRLDLEHCGEQRRALAYERLYARQPAQITAQTHEDLYLEAAREIGIDEAVTYLEFGVANGNSLRRFSHLFINANAQLYAFDSFVGLPEPWKMHDRGAFSTNGMLPELADPRVVFVKGWFQNTLDDALKSLRSRLSGPVLIHFDADLYSSTLFLLTSLWHACPAYHFIMDDFMVDDIVALHDFTLAYPVELEFIAQLAGGRPHSVFGKMKRVPFSLD